MALERRTLTASDGYLLAADLAIPAGEPHTLVLIAPAMAVPRGFYRKWMEHLANAGFAALVLDYRGIGDSAPKSLRGFKADLVDWARLDLQAGLDALGEWFPGVPRVWFGHSVGGQLLGLMPAPPIERALFIASQAGYWRHWPGATSLAMAAFWYAGVPTLTAITGKLPMKSLGQGLDVPAGVARQWADWGRDPQYIGKTSSQLPDAAFHRLAVPIRSVAIADDKYAPPASIPPLLALYSVAAVESQVLSAREQNLPSIGHFGAFRRPSLWAPWVDFLKGDAR